MDALARDLVDAVRRLWRAPGLSVAVALTLGLGIGANTAVFSIVDVLYLRPLPVRDPDRVVMVMGSRGAGMFSYPNYADYREQQDVFTALVASRPLDADITTGARTEGTSGLLVTHDYFHTLGVEPTLGRVFGAGDAADDAEAVAILSERLWRRSFDGDPRWVGRTVQLKGTEVRIIGVVTPTFSVDAVDDRSVDIWLVLRPGMLGETASYRNRDANWVWMQGRLKPGVSRTEAQAAMDAVTRRLEREYPTNEGMRLSVLSELQWRLRRRDGGSFYQLLFGAVASILLLACANVTNLLLAHGQARAREIAIRAALGATRRRIARQLLTESLVLSLLGGAAGWIIGSWTLAALLAPRGAANLPAGMRLDARVLAFTAALSMAAGLLSGLLPALRSARTDLVAVMKGGGWAGFRTERLPMMKSLVVGQVALSLVLLVCTGLFVRTFQHLWNFDLGYPTEGLVWTRVDLRPLKYDEAQVRLAQARVLARVRSLPDVTAAGMGPAPLIGFPWTNVVVDGVKDQGETRFTTAGAGYFRTLGVAPLRGRDFDEGDGPGRAAVAIVNESMAGRLWADGNPLGRQFQPWAGAPPREVVGVVPDRDEPFARREPLFYLPLGQRNEARTWVLARTNGRAEAFRESLRQVILSTEPGATASPAQTIEDALQQGSEEIRYGAAVLGGLAVLGLGLAAVGLYGLMSYSTGRATRDIGIRIALGADRIGMQHLMLRHGARLVVIGIAVGLVLSVAASNALRSLFLGSPADPLTFTIVPAFLLGVGLLATYLPARRAARVDPVVALRHD